jgi:hypothetical protein
MQDLRVSCRSDVRRVRQYSGGGFAASSKGDEHAEALLGGKTTDETFCPRCH